MTFAQYTAPGLTLDEGKEISEVLQARLHDLNELHLSLKHAHWNVTGPDYIAGHEMSDPSQNVWQPWVHPPTVSPVRWSQHATTRITP